MKLEGCELKMDEITSKDIEKLTELYPELTAHGFGVYGDDDVVEERLALIDAVEAVKICMDWLQMQEVTKTVRRKHTSYFYKHEVERWHGETYIPNGALIAAAYLLGLKVQRDKKSANALLNIKLVR
jgi:hypothetical protein